MVFWQIVSQLWFLAKFLKLTEEGSEEFWVQEEKEYPFDTYIIAVGLFHCEVPSLSHEPSLYTVLNIYPGLNMYDVPLNSVYI